MSFASRAPVVTLLILLITFLCMPSGSTALTASLRFDVPTTAGPAGTYENSRSSMQRITHDGITPVNVYAEFSERPIFLSDNWCTVFDTLRLRPALTSSDITSDVVGSPVVYKISVETSPDNTYIFRLSDDVITTETGGVVTLDQSNAVIAMYMPPPPTSRL